MAVRTESVRLSLEDDFSTGMAKAAVATALLSKELNNLDGTSVKATKSIGPLGNEMDKTAASTERVGASTRKAGPDIDKYSGRLRTLADVALTLGPALIPIGASAIPVLTASLVGFTAAAGGIGTAVLAFKGIGDGLKALDDYQLEPTAENLQKVRVEMEKLGPAGAEFTHYLDGLEPTLRDLQNIARAGIFPGVEDGIDGLIERLPQVRRIVAELADGMGDLARDTGEALGGDRFDAFFDYIETDARPTLEAFAHSAGNVALGIGNMLVAFAPVSRDFTGGLESATEAFARWTEGLDDNQSFQEFVGYVRESGPQVVDLLGALAGALAGLIEAAAPLGRAVVPTLTALANAFAAVTQSPVGPALYTAAGGLIAFNRAAAVTSGISKKMSGEWATLGLQATNMRDKLALLGTGGAAATLAVGTFLDEIDRLDSRGRSNDTIDATVQSLQDLQDTIGGSNLSKYAQDLHIDLARLTDDLAQNGEQGEYVQSVMKQLEGDTHGAGAAVKGFLGEDLPFYTGNTLKSERALKDLNSVIGDVGAGLGAWRGPFAGVLDDMEQMVSAATDLSGALSQLNGWFDKRDAVRGYKDSIDDLKKSLKDGFSREDAANIDAVGRGIIQVAEQIKNPVQQANFLANARASLDALAKTSGPQAKAAIQEVVDKMDALGVTHAKPKVTVDDKATPTLNDLDIHLRRTGNANPKPKVTVDPGNSLSLLDRISSLLAGLRDRTITVTTNQRGGVTSSAGGRSTPAPSADGGTVPKSGLPYADRYHYLLADGERVISNRHGQADRHAAILDAINRNALPGFADGGTAGGSQSLVSPGSSHGHNVNDGFTLFVAGIWSTANYLKALNKALSAQQKAVEKSEKALDRETQKRDAIADQMSSLSNAIGSGLRSDIFAKNDDPWAASAGGVAGANAALTGDINQGQMFSASLAALQGRGLHGAALQALLEQAASTQDVGLLQQFAGASSSDLANYQSLYDLRDQTLSGVGQASGQAVFGEAYAAQTKVLEQTRDQTKGLRQDVKTLTREVKTLQQIAEKSPKATGKHVSDGVNGAGDRGDRNRVYAD